MTKVEIQVKNGTVTIAFGGAPSSIDRGEGTPAAKGLVGGKVIGGDAGGEPGHSGGGTPGGGGTVVIGPIVVSADGIEASGGDTHSGGDAGGEPGSSGGGVPGGSGGGVVVIGPIVIACGGAGREQTKKATAIDEEPDK
jgi:hypothetical protein